MKNKINDALNGAKTVADLVRSILDESGDFDLQRLLKQIEADLMDVQHKLAIALRLSGEKK
jgi:hypothetical protein